MKSEELNKVPSDLTTTLFSGNTDESKEECATQENLSTEQCHNSEKLVTHIHSFLSPETLTDIRLVDELQDLYERSHAKAKYMWLTDSPTQYHFGGRSYQPHGLDKLSGISTIMTRINAELNLNLDACLVVRYSPDDALSLHQDNESVLDQSHPIVVTSVGAVRTLQFWDTNSEKSGHLVKEVSPKQGDIVIMGVGCQEHLWHKVLPCQTGSQEGARFALSFRKLRVGQWSSGSSNNCRPCNIHTNL